MSNAHFMMIPGAPAPVAPFSHAVERDYGAMNEVYRSYFPKDRLPARTCVGVTALARGALVEIDFVARR